MTLSQFRVFKSDLATKGALRLYLEDFAYSCLALDRTLPHFKELGAILAAIGRFSLNQRS